MDIVYVIFEWLLVLALLGLIGVIAWLVMAALKIKTSVMADAKRLYEPPTRSVKVLIGTGKGIAQQETVRARHIASSAMVAVGAVKETTGEVKVVTDSIHVSELKAALADVQNVVKFVGLLTRLSKTTATKQGASRETV